VLTFSLLLAIVMALALAGCISFFLPIAAHLHGKAVKSGEKSYNLLIERRLFP